LVKKILFAVLVVGLLLGSGLIFLLSTVDSTVKEMVEAETARLTGSVVTVEDVDFSVVSGKGVVTGLEVRNPEGFSGQPALSMGEIIFELEMDFLSLDMVTVREIKADSIEILLEKNGEGKVNYQVLSQNLKNAAGEQSSQESTSGSWVPDLKISEFIMSEGRVTLSGFGEYTKSLKTPELRLQDLGGPGGAPPEKVGEEILSGIFSEIIRQSVQAGVQNWIEENSAIPDALKKLLNRGLQSIN
jgi:hypothetical protein